MSNLLKNIICCCCSLIAFISFILLIGIAGGVDTDQLTIDEAVKKSIIWIILLVIGVIGIIKTEKEEDKYDRL